MIIQKLLQNKLPKINNRALLMRSQQIVLETSLRYLFQFDNFQTSRTRTGAQNIAQRQRWKERQKAVDKVRPNSEPFLF